MTAPPHEPVAWMYWNDPDTQRHFSQLREPVGNYWTNIVPLYAAPAPSAEPQNLYDALSTIYDWLCDDRLTQWPYMENGPFYSDLPKYQEVARAALAAAPARGER